MLTLSQYNAKKAAEAYSKKCRKKAAKSLHPKKRK